ncbi:MAG: hypothetical protein H7A01_11885 [Hahellaceae bacterium]|nr:hypothetical protein [Hahellaceae bacterium]MCP5209981.1 hypothetical protein [Hahellaceae bacterium]
MPENNESISIETLETELRTIAADHFLAAHTRVPEVYRQHFSSTNAIFKRHWENRRDIPQDILSMPKTAYRIVKNTIRKVNASVTPAPPKLSGKEQALLALIQGQLLQLERLTDALLQKTRTYSADIVTLEALAAKPLNKEEQAAINEFLTHKIQSFTLPRDGSRDLLLFLTIGMLGKGLSQKVVFGSSIATGTALAQSLYLSQQSWWSAAWLHWAGSPAWVTAAGATGGVALTLLLAPIISPVAEMMVNRVRGEKHLHKLIEQVETNLLDHRPDRLDIAGLFASYAQLAPDLIQVLRNLRG